MAAEQVLIHRFKFKAKTKRLPKLTGQRRLSAWGRKVSTLAGCRMDRGWSRMDAAELQCWSLSAQSSSQGLQPDWKMPEKQMPCHANTAL